MTKNHINNILIECKASLITARTPKKECDSIWNEINSCDNIFIIKAHTNITLALVFRNFISSSLDSVSSSLIFSSIPSPLLFLCYRTGISSSKEAFSGRFPALAIVISCRQLRWHTTAPLADIHTPFSAFLSEFRPISEGLHFYFENFKAFNGTGGSSEGYHFFLLVK